jgi:hypothetical protein
MDEVRNGGYVRQGWVLNTHKVATVSGRTREREIGVCAEICVCFRACFFATRVATETCWSSAHVGGGGGGTYLETLNPFAL